MPIGVVHSLLEQWQAASQKVFLPVIWIKLISSGSGAARSGVKAVATVVTIAVKHIAVLMTEDIRAYLCFFLSLPTLLAKDFALTNTSHNHIVTASAPFRFS